MKRIDASEIKNIAFLKESGISVRKIKTQTGYSVGSITKYCKLSEQKESICKGGRKPLLPNVIQRHLNLLYNILAVKAYDKKS